MESKEETLKNKLGEILKAKGNHHANSLLNKWKKWSEARDNLEYLASLVEITEKYLEYRKSVLECINELNFNKMTECLNGYKDFSRERGEKLKLTIQEEKSFQSSILEEFLFILFSRKNEEWEVLEKGKEEVYSNIYFNPKSLKDFINSSSFKVDKKEQDFAIYKRIKIDIDGKKEDLKIPIVSIECKTNLDKTMLQGSIATAEKIKRGNPQAKFYIVVELYDVSYKEEIYGTQIDQIYILRKQKRKWKKMREGKALNPIDSEVIKNLWEDVSGFLKKQVWSDNKGFVEAFGK